MSKCCNNSCDTNQGNSLTSLDGLTDIIESLVKLKVNAELTILDDKFKLLEEKIDLMNEYLAKAETAAMVAQTAKEHTDTSVESVNASMALLSEKLEDGFNKNGSFTINNVQYNYKHGIIVSTEDI